MDEIRRELEQGTIEGMCRSALSPGGRRVRARLPRARRGRCVGVRASRGAGRGRPLGRDGATRHRTPGPRHRLDRVLVHEGRDRDLRARARRRGELDIDAPVAEYWPEFARERQGSTRRCRMMLDHSVGLPACKTPASNRAAATTGTTWSSRSPNEEPFWEPGIRNGYHMINFGWTVGELVRARLGTLARHRSSATRSPSRSASTSGSVCPEEHGAARRADAPCTCRSRATPLDRVHADRADGPAVASRRSRC